MSTQPTYHLLATAAVPDEMVREAAEQGFVLDVVLIQNDTLDILK